MGLNLNKVCNNLEGSHFKSLNSFLPDRFLIYWRNWTWRWLRFDPGVSYYPDKLVAKQIRAWLAPEMRSHGAETLLMLSSDSPFRMTQVKLPIDWVNRVQGQASGTNLEWGQRIWCRNWGIRKWKFDFSSSKQWVNEWSHIRTAGCW
jgi:hypothetical protein